MELVFAAPGDDNGLLPINCIGTGISEGGDELGLVLFFDMVLCWWSFTNPNTA